MQITLTSRPCPNSDGFFVGVLVVRGPVRFKGLFALVSSLNNHSSCQGPPSGCCLGPAPPSKGVKLFNAILWSAVTTPSSLAGPYHRLLRTGLGLSRTSSSPSRRQFRRGHPVAWIAEQWSRGDQKKPNILNTNCTAGSGVCVRGGRSFRHGVGRMGGLIGVEENPREHFTTKVGRVRYCGLQRAICRAAVNRLSSVLSGRQWRCSLRSRLAARSTAFGPMFTCVSDERLAYPEAVPAVDGHE